MIPQFQNPRAAGISDHIERAQWFFDLGKQAVNPVERMRFFLAAVYSSRAVIEIVIDNKENKIEFCNKHFQNVPFFNLIEKIRIHDFHRFGCIASDAEQNYIFMGGLKRLEAKSGIAACFLNPIPTNTTSGQSKIDDSKHRPLIQKNNNFFDEKTQKYHDLEFILSEHIAHLKNINFMELL